METPTPDCTSSAKLEVIKNYIDARRRFLSFASQHDDLKGNDNIIGRIGEYIAISYLRSKGRSVDKHEQSNNTGFDLFEGDTRISVKLISAENTRGRTTRLKEPWDELILIELDPNYDVLRLGHLFKSEFNKARLRNKKLSETPIIKRSMLERFGLIGQNGTVDVVFKIWQTN